MSAILRIHRGPASPERVKMRIYTSEAITITPRDGDIIEVQVEENPNAEAPILQGEFLRITALHPAPVRPA